MTTAHPPESRSADSTAVSDEGQAPPLVHEMAPGQRFPSPNQVDMERGPFWRAGLLPESPWEAHPVTIIANLGEPIGESRLNHKSRLLGIPYDSISSEIALGTVGNCGRIGPTILIGRYPSKPQFLQHPWGHNPRNWTNSSSPCANGRNRCSTELRSNDCVTTNLTLASRRINQSVAIPNSLRN